MSNINDKIQYWLDVSAYDLKTAKVMQKGRRYLYVGFMCHQVIEKTLKAYYWFKNKKEPPYTHNLITLAKKTGLYEQFTDEQKDFIDTLTPLNIQARYPEEKEKWAKRLDKNSCKILFKKTKEISEWIKQYIKK